MADAYGKLTGRPGICLVTRGPGATHASVGLHTACQDSTPLILLVGQVGSGEQDREAFQELDYRRLFGQLSKWVAQIDRVDRIPEYLARAFATACSGRPGPVVLALPEDVLDAPSGRRGRAPVAARHGASRPRAARAAPRPARGGRAAAGPDRRAGVERRRRRRPARLPRGERAARGGGVQAPGCARQRLAELRRRYRHRHQPPARGPRPGRRRPARRRAAARGDHHLGLHAARAADAEADARPCSPGRRGARTGLPARARDPRGDGAVRRRGARAPGRAPLGRLDGRRPRGVRAVAARRAGAGRPRSARVRRPPPRAACRRDRDERRGQLHRLGASVLALPRAPQPAGADERRDGVRRAGGRRREARRTRTVRSCASPATATS